MARTVLKGGEDMKKRQCHKCPFDERNGGTKEQRQEHCPECNLCEITPIDKSRSCIWIDGSQFADGVVQRYAKKLDEDRSILAEKGIEENQVKLILAFCNNFVHLDLLDRLIMLSMIVHDGDNTAIVEETKLSRQTIIAHRKRLESDPYWKEVLDIMAIAPRKTRKRQPKGQK